MCSQPILNPPVISRQVVRSSTTAVIMLERFGDSKQPWSILLLIRRRAWCPCFAAYTLFYTVTLTFDLEHLQRIACDVINLCTKFERNRAIHGGVIGISVFDLEHCVACCARLWDNFQQV